MSRIGSVESPIAPAEAKRLIRLAFDLGINFFDTADVYGQGDSERILGAALSSNRAQVVIATKVGLTMSTKARIASYAKPVLRPILRYARKSSRTATPSESLISRPTMPQNFSREHIRRSVDASLRRLRTDYIDLFMLHSPPVTGLELDDISEELQLAKRAGKIRAIGISSRSAEDFAVWSNWSVVDAIQLRLNTENSSLFSPPGDAPGRRISVIARQVLGSGTSPRDALRSALKASDIVLFGTTSVAHLQDNVAAIANG